MVFKIQLEKQLIARLKILQLTVRKPARSSSKSAKMATLRELYDAIAQALLRLDKSERKCCCLIQTTRIIDLQ